MVFDTRMYKRLSNVPNTVSKNTTYGQQVIENLQTTAKITPTAKAAEKFAEMPDQGEYNSYSWVGKMLDR